MLWCLGTSTQYLCASSGHVFFLWMMSVSGSEKTDDFCMILGDRPTPFFFFLLSVVKDTQIMQSMSLLGGRES